MLMGCGENVDFVPRNNPHFVGPTIVQQHQEVDENDDDDVDDIDLGTDGRSLSSIRSLKFNFRDGVAS